MPNVSDSVIALSFSDALTVLMDACGIPGQAHSAFQARIGHLQRLGVPRSNGARGLGPLDYGLVELAALATAIRLMDGFMIPTLAARYVLERWVVLAPFALAGAKSVLSASYLARRPIHGGTIALFRGNALAELGEKRKHDGRYDGPLGPVTIMADATSVEFSTAAGGAGLILDSTTYMPALVQRAAETVMATDVELAFELDRLRFAR